MDKNVISVSELNKYIKNIIEGDMGLRNIFVKGEISNFKLHSSGHMYFTLKDEDSKIRSIMFRTYNNFLKFIPEDGMKVIVKGNISIYEKDGQYQLYCTKMEPDGIGSLYLAYEQLKEKLQNEGLFDEKVKKSIPFLPRRIGVATSPTGAVIRDIINVSLNRYKNINILLFPVKVQGDGAAESIITAIDYFNTQKDVDVIIIGRGGGSIEELWAFNNESLARAIRKSRIPIVSAVGHETDFTIADFVSDLRASTPSHAAEMCVPSMDEVKYRIKVNKNNILLGLKRKIDHNRHNVRYNLNGIERYSPISIINQKIQFVDSMENLIAYKMNNNFFTQSNNFKMLIRRIDDLSPLKILSRGYGYVEKSEKVISSIKSIKAEEVIRLHMHDGYADCKVENIKEGELWQLKNKN